MRHGHLSSSRVLSLLGSAALAATVLVGVSSAPSTAATPSGSLVFVRDHDLWVAAADGSGQTRITSSGTARSPWEEPTMADNGVIAALRGGEIVTMRQNGSVLTRLQVPAGHLFVQPEMHVTPVVDVEISPDGSKVAYQQLRTRNSGGRIVIDRAMGFTRPGVLDRLDTHGVIAHASDPHWLTNNRVLVRHDQAAIYQLGSGGGAATDWFAIWDAIADWYTTFEDLEVSPDGSMFAATTWDEKVVWGPVVGNPRTSIPGPPDLRCITYDDEGEIGFSDVSFGASGDSLVFAQLSPTGGSDVWRSDGLTGACEAVQLTRVLENASSPDWSPAPFDTTPALHSTRRPALTGKARVGATLHASAGTWSIEPDRVRYLWLRNGKPVKRTTGRTYPVRCTDRGKRIAVRVTAFHDGRRASATSQPKQIR